jgi:sugar phosphate isomerase/epimerase
MHFGIMDMQLDLLVAAAVPVPGNQMSAAGFGHAVLVERLFDQGFDLIELGGDLSLFFPDSLSPQAIEQLAMFKEARGVSYTVHLPLWSVEPSTLLNEVREGSVAALVKTIKATLPLNPEMYVLHATGALAAEFYQMRIPDAAKSLLLRQFQHNAGNSIKSILGATGIDSRLLAIETIEFPFELTLELANLLDLSMCLDTGHVLVGFSGPVSLDEVLELCLPRLGEIHLHDGPWQGPERKIGYGKDHQPLGSGDLDIPRFLDRLTQASYKGPIIFELSIQDALKSMDAIWAVRPQYLTAYR